MKNITSKGLAASAAPNPPPTHGGRVLARSGKPKAEPRSLTQNMARKMERAGASPGEIRAFQKLHTEGLALLHAAGALYRLHVPHLAAVAKKRGGAK